jgi:DNA mismatch endonuclease, patch repair protein
VLRSRKIAIFIHGCYWHQHEGCKLAYSDRKYTDKWKKKFNDNKERDARVTKRLIEKGWRVAVIWECVTRDTLEFKGMLNKFQNWIGQNEVSYFESKYKK